MNTARSRRAPRHSVYVVLLDLDGAPAYYVGLTGLTPEERFARHKRGIQTGKGFVRKYGVRLLPELYAHLNPMTYADAVVQERDLAVALRARGWQVHGGH